MPRGRVTSFNDIIGSGFIRPDNGDKNVRVSYKDIKKSGYKILHEGQEVEYQLLETPKGPKAIKVVITG
jgi:cold shock protein